MIHATSDTQRYIDLTGQALRGEIDVVFERYLPGGLTERVFGPRRNPEEIIHHFGFDPIFFKAALNSYYNWPVKWWREVVQNSVDPPAGANQIDLDVDQREDGTWVVSCTDNGAGMDLETLTTRFLMLGGSKKGAGAAGGFGVAKQLLVMPWLHCEIQTRDLVASGPGPGPFRITQGNPYVDGTRITVIMPEDRHTTIGAALAFLTRSSLSGVNITVAGLKFTDWLHRGRRSRDISMGTIFWNKSSKINELLVRHNGMFMFEESLPVGVKGCVIVDLQGPPKDLFTDNREALRGKDIRDEINAFTNELAGNREEALRDKTIQFARTCLTGPLFEPGKHTAEVLDIFGPMPELDTGKESVTITGETLERLQDLLDALQAGGEVIAGLTTSVTPELAKVVLARHEIVGAQQAETLAMRLAWTPSFYLTSTIPGFTPAAKFQPETMEPKVRALAQLWANLCMWVLIQAGCRREYGIGFVFSKDVAAQVQPNHKGIDWIMLNPYKTPGKVSGAIWSKSNKDDLKKLYVLAVHECTHFVSGVNHHALDFSQAEDELWFKCVDGFTKVRAIAATVRARDTGSTRPARKERTWDRPELRDLLQVTVREDADGDLDLTVGVDGKANSFLVPSVDRSFVHGLLGASVVPSSPGRAPGSALDFYYNFGKMPRQMYLSRNDLKAWARGQLGRVLDAVEDGLYRAG